MKELKMLKEKGKAEGSKEKESGLAAAMKIQSTWRGFATRKKTRRRKMEEMVLIGMIPPSVTAKSYYMEESEMVNVFFFMIMLLQNINVICNMYFKVFFIINHRWFWNDIKHKKNFRPITKRH